jgi:WD40 repeat protein
MGLALDLKAGTVRVIRSDSETAGAGFVVSENGLIATCSHVIQPEASQKTVEPRPEKVHVIFCATGEQMAARVLPEFWRPADREDVAILQLEGELPTFVKPLPIGSSAGSGNHAFQTFGFPESGLKEGSYGDGHILNELPMQMTRVLQVSSPQVTPGFSGGPVLDMVTDRIVGMVTAIAAPDKYGRMAETAYVTPSETLREICPQLKISDTPPYMGLAAFAEKDARFFFGRRKTVESLAEALQSRPRFLLVMGPSGSGKSSVIQAGLIPSLRKGAVPGSDRWRILVARPADQPFRNLEAKGLEGAASSLTEAINHWLKRQTGSEHMLLVLDQFEEFLVTCALPLRNQFWASLKELIDSDLPVTIMAVMRDDFYSRFAQDAPSLVMEWISRGIFPVSASLETEDLREIIELPARQVGLALEEGLAQVIINDVLESCREEGGRTGRSTVLPLLEFALTQVWERRDQGSLTHQAYYAAGKVAGSLTAWADEVCRSLEKEGLGKLTRRVFTDLVNLGDEAQRLPDSRRRRLLDDLCNDPMEREQVHRIVTRLADARLVTTSSKTGQVTVEIIHDSLIREWARLRRWLKKDRSFLSWKRELETDAREWKETSPEDVYGRDEGRLLRGRRLDEAERWHKERERDLGETQRVFISASLDLREREREKEKKARAEKERTRRRNMVVLSFITVVALVFAGIAYELKGQADAKTEEVLAWGLVAQSEEMIDVTGSLKDSVLLAVESVTHKEIPKGIKALRRGLALLPRAVFVLKHEDQVRSIAFSPDGKLLATGSDEGGGKLRIWSAITGKELLDPPLVHDDWVRSIDFSPDGRRLATGCDDSNARIWSISGDKEPLVLPHGGPVKSVAFSPDGKWLATGGGYKAICIWNLSTNNSIDLPLEDNVTILSVAFSPDGKKLAAAGNTSTVMVWNVSTEDRILHLPQMHSDQIHSIAFSPDGAWIATGSRDAKTSILNASTGEKLFVLDHGNSVVESVAFSPDGKRLATACNNDNTARIWDLSTKKVVARMEHDGWVRAVAFSHDGKRVATASNDKTVIVWDVANEEPACLNYRDYVSSLAFSPDGTKFASASNDSTAMVWNLSARGLQFNPLMHDGGVTSIVFSPDGKRLATGCRSGKAGIWDASDGKNLYGWLEHNSSVNCVAFSPDVTKLATASDDDSATVWDASTGKEIVKLPHNADVAFVAFSPDGTKLATASRDSGAVDNKVGFSIIKVWNATNWKNIFNYTMFGGNINSMKFSPDGTRLAIGGQLGASEILDASSGTQLINLWNNSYDVQSMNFSADGTKLAVTGYDQKVWIYDAFTGKKLLDPRIGGWGYSVAFSPDGTKFAVACAQDTARVWDISTISTGNEISRMQHDDDVTLVAFSPDGMKLATGSKDGTAKVWYLQSKDLICEACSRLEKISDDEWWEKYCSHPVPA